MTAAVMHEYESSIPATQAAAKGGAYIEEPTVSESGFTVVAVAANTADKFSIIRNSNGEVERKCKSSTKGCSGGSESSW
jgi:hypothetical protein